MTESAGLIVLNCTKIKDSTVVVHTLSREYGRRSFISSVKKGSAMTMFLPLNIIEATVTENPKSQLWRIGSISLKYSLSDIRNNIYKNTMTLFMSEVLFKTLKDGAREEGLFEICEKAILSLDALKSDFANFHLYFLLELASALGFSPSIEDLAPFVEDNLAVVGKFLNLSFAEAMLIPLKGEERNRIAESIIKYIAFHCECNLNIRSLEVLRQIYE